ncbi:MAG: purine-nucleoside phosphorylase [Saccharofermentans sp.]|nr:purine-nucleoside phosphorylase [Saccharofermentans sp.]
MIDKKREYVKQVVTASEYIRRKVDEIPKICIVLGSGLSPLADKITQKTVLPYVDIPYFPVSTAPGHEGGALIYGDIDGIGVFIMRGRFHYYEGYDLSVTTFYVRVMAYLGIKTLIVTNAAGGINDGMTPPSLMIIEDHISFLAESSLRGPNLDYFGVRFPDQTHVYDPEYVEILSEASAKLGIKITKGVYAFCKGPQYETPAEIRALKILGADAVGMSTVPETIVASHCGMRIAGISCISNLAAGISPKPLDGQEVLLNANLISNDNCELVMEFVRRIGEK